MLLLSASQPLHLGIAHVLVCEAVLLFMLAAGRRLAELELVLFLVQVCAHIYCCTYVCNGVHCYRCVCLLRVCVCMSVWCVLCAFCVYMHTCFCIKKMCASDKCAHHVSAYECQYLSKYLSVVFVFCNVM